MVQTALGTLGSPARAVVDGAGRIGPLGAGWQLEWWIGADDRWRVPAAEPSVRQRLVEGVPVVETAMHVPGGDIVHRAYGVRAGRSDVVAIEVANRTPVPVALAIALVPGSRAVRRIEAANGPGPPGTGFVIVADGSPAVLLPGRPRFSATGCGGDAVFDEVASGEAREEPGTVECPDGRAQAAYLFPLAHGVVFRAGVLHRGVVRGKRFAFLRRRRPRRPAPDGTEHPPISALPPSDAAVRAWQEHLDRGMRLELPPGRLSEAVAASRAHLMLAAGLGPPVPPVVATALARFGLGTEASQNGAGRRSPGFVESPVSTATVLDRLARLLDTASPTWTWPGNDRGELSAELCLLAREALVSDHESVAMCPSLPAAWFRQNLAVHDAPTTAGTLSFAVRWHGARAAVLWALRDGRTTSARIVAPGLDPGWSSAEPSGEALLGPVAEPVAGPAL